MKEKQEEKGAPQIRCIDEVERTEESDRVVSLCKEVCHDVVYLTLWRFTRLVSLTGLVDSHEFNVLMPYN
jgi:hypothetical protein